MEPTFNKSLDYSYDDACLRGYFSRPGGGALPGILLVHDAFGVSDFVKGIADRLSSAGYATLAADVWGDGKQLTSESEIGPMIGRFAADRKTWMGRLQAARKTLAAQPGVDGDKVVIIGYCFGGASALEYLRTVGDVRGAVSIHGGLDLVSEEWAPSHSLRKALLLTGYEDPMAALSKLESLQQSMNNAGVDWEVNLYGHTRHGFTRPDSDRANKPQIIAYHAQSDKRAWAALHRFLEESLAT
ncbi:dienelactone hydrolase family protein [Pseudomonas putida]|uniref:dienelactone hydrolase family protein n=1 Tax=Pseudomonas putida TaxID=303 RepID=UPI0023631C4E|nr:dienelactone hydrolase family protein [Pseudomonas putida]MDD2050945.1 dienelactone hydrolase family protein [Pseudomonas putida]